MAPSSRRPLARRFLDPLLLPLALLLVLLEVTVWRWLTMLGDALARLAPFAWLERKVQAMRPGMVVTVFVLPFAAAIPPLKFGELWLLTHHHYGWAAALIIGGKVVGAAFATRLFEVARPKMLQVRWFARAYAALMWLHDLGHALVERMPGIAAARALVHRVKRRLRYAVDEILAALRPPAGGGGPSLARRLGAALRRARRPWLRHAAPDRGGKG